VATIDMFLKKGISSGLAVSEERESAIVVHPGFVVHVEPFSILRICRSAKSKATSELTSGLGRICLDGAVFRSGANEDRARL
jgi:hypothetical protein